jgi:hypothetical protein
LIYSSPTLFTGVVEDIHFLSHTDDATYPIAQVTRNVNERYREILSWIFEVYDGWRFNDSNTSDDVLYADQTLTSGVATYAMPATALTIDGIEVKDSAGNWRRLDFISFKELEKQTSVTEFADVSGDPKWFMLEGDTIELKPTPNYTQATSLRVWFRKDISTIGVTDTTLVPGFNPMFHRALTCGGVLDYKLSQPSSTSPVETTRWQAMWNEWKERIQTFYSGRITDPITVIPKYRNAR